MSNNKNAFGDFKMICHGAQDSQSSKKAKNQSTSDIEKSTKLAELLGNLKAVEAKERVKHFRNKQQLRDELQGLLRAQPTALAAVRLQNLLQIPPTLKVKDPLDKVQKMRVEEIISGDKSWIQRSRWYWHDLEDSCATHV